MLHEVTKRAKVLLDQHKEAEYLNEVSNKPHMSTHVIVLTTVFGRLQGVLFSNIDYIDKYWLSYSLVSKDPAYRG